MVYNTSYLSSRIFLLRFVSSLSGISISIFYPKLVSPPKFLELGNICSRLVLLLLLASSDREPLPFDVSSEFMPAPRPFFRLPPDEPIFADIFFIFYMLDRYFSNDLSAFLVAGDSGVFLPEVYLTTDVWTSVSASFTISATACSTTASTAIDNGPFGDFLSLGYYDSFGL